MKLSAETINVLKNFAKINPNFKTEKGNTIRTKDQGNTQFAIATIAETLPCDFAIYDLTKFLTVVDGLFKDPDLEFKEHEVIISSQDKEDGIQHFWYCEPGIIDDVQVLRKFPEPDAEFTLSEKLFNRMNRCVGVLSGTMKEIRFIGGNGVVKLVGYDKSKSDKNTFEIILHDYDGADFDVSVAHKRLEMIPGTYHCSVINGRILSAENTEYPIKYAVALTVDEAS